LRPALYTARTYQEGRKEGEKERKGERNRGKRRRKYQSHPHLSIFIFQ
jgi:hypothetical protein